MLKHGVARHQIVNEHAVLNRDFGNLMQLALSIDCTAEAAYDISQQNELNGFSTMILKSLQALLPSTS